MGKPKSPRTRMREYRERTKNNKEKKEEFLEKDRKRKQAVRLKEQEYGISSVVKSHRNKLNRERVSKFRAKKKIDFEKNDDIPAYSSQRSLGKAVSRASKSLPSSPRKKKVVVKQLAERVGLLESSIKPKHVISEETVKKVSEFYCRDDISRQAPGKKDYITVWRQDGKVKLQKRHLYYTIKETHSLFIVEYPDVKIGKSKFAELKPVNVLHSSEIPKDACLCMYHENITLLCDALHRVMPTFPTYSSSFVSNLVCSPDTEKCMTGNCDTCSQKIESWLNDFQGPELNAEISWYEWAREEENNQPSHSRRNNSASESSAPKKKMMKCCRQGTVLASIENLKEKLPEFLLHVFIKREQSNCFQTKLLSIPSRSAVVQVDFSENYTLQHQGEIQSAYWNQSQLTLFPVCVWMQKEKKSMVYVSDELDHDKTSVLVFIHKVLFQLTTENGITKVDIFSDGPSSQFKNQYVFNSLPFLLEHHQLDCLNWNFFATSHGKGAVDGVGGTVKRNVWMETLSRREVVNSLEDFCRVSKKKDQKVNVIAMSADDIKKCAREMELEKIFSASTAVASIKKMHFVTASKDGTIKWKEFTNKQDQDHHGLSDEMTEITKSTDESDSDEWYEEQCQKYAPPAEIDVGDFVIFNYEGELFPGKVTKVYSGGAKVKAFEKCAGGWRWPKQVDEIDYLAQDIITKIQYPEPVNNRGTFRVRELESK